MRAALIDRYGPPEIFRIGEHPPPACGRRDVLIEVRASSVNPVDTKMRRGGMRLVAPLRFPWVLGLDVSGVVRQVGSAVTRFAVGDEVYASPTHRRSGCYAELVAIDERVVAKKPSNLSHLEAAGLPLVALTAWVSLVDCGRVEPGQRVLIHAGAGGVGSVAIPIAKSLGAEVITTTSTRNVELCRALGADLVIDYTQQDHTELLSDLDVVVDSLGIKERPRSLKVLRRGGRLIRLEAGIPAQVARHGPLLGTLFAVSGGAAFTIRAWLDKRVRVFHPVRPLDGARLAKITELVERGVIRPQIHQVYPLEQIAAAHADSEAGHARGKIIVDLQPQS